MCNAPRLARKPLSVLVLGTSRFSFQHIFDRASDGIVSAEEIAHVVQHVLASESTATEACAIAKDVNFDLLLLDVGCTL